MKMSSQSNERKCSKHDKEIKGSKNVCTARLVVFRPFTARSPKKIVIPGMQELVDFLPSGIFSIHHCTNVDI